METNVRRAVHISRRGNYIDVGFGVARSERNEVVDLFAGAYKGMGQRQSRGEDGH